MKTKMIAAGLLVIERGLTNAAGVFCNVVYQLLRGAHQAFLIRNRFIEDHPKRDEPITV